MTLVLQTLGSDQTLDTGRLGVRLLALTLGLDLATNDVLADLLPSKISLLASHVSSQTLPPPADQDRRSCRAGDDGIAMAYSTYIVILAEAEEPADLGGALGAETLGLDGIGEAGDVGLALLDNGKSEDGEIGTDDAAADRLALTLTGTAGAVAGVAVGKEKADTVGHKHALLHWEALLVVATGDAEDVALPLVTERVGWDLSAHLIRGQYTHPRTRIDFRGRGWGRARALTYALPTQWVS